MERTPVEVAQAHHNLFTPEFHNKDSSSSVNEIEWRKIPGFSMYSASSNGEIRKEATGCLMSQKTDSHGYLSCSLSNDAGKQIKRQVHRYVALAFFGEPNNGLIVCHGKEGRLVNKVSNLRYDTYFKNSIDMVCDGNALNGSRHPSSKLNEQKVSAILKLIAAKNLTHKQIGEMFSVDGACIGRIAIGLTWRHVERPENMPKKRRAYSSFRHQRVERIDQAIAARFSDPDNAGLFEFRVAKAGKGAAK